MTIEIAVLLTSFNRKVTTLRCLAQLARQDDLDGVNVRIVLVDDGSTDGTALSVAETFPYVTVLAGSGSLYWNGGMLLADTEAMTRGPVDYLLWLNDDVELQPDALRSLLNAAEELDGRSIVVGSVRDSSTESSSYGGYVRLNRRRPMQLSRVEPTGSAQPVDTMNGNVVLVPTAIRQALGATDCRFSHNMADMDYAYRARSQGWGVALAPSFVGSCSPNSAKGRWRDPAVPLADRVRIVLSVKGLPPREWLVFTRRHCGWRWPRYFVSPYVTAVVCGWRGRKK